MAELISSAEVEGPVLAIVHVDESGTTPVRTVLAHATKEDATLTIEEENEDFNPGAYRRTNRIATNNSVDFELATAMATDTSALELLGIQDSNGRMSFDTSDRALGPDAYIEVHYFSDEPDYTTVTLPADAELTHRLGDVEVRNPEVDMSATPPTVSLVMWVEGGVWPNYSEA
ncbi:hypothetical protein [Natrinema soli]|uniref:Uncharacterized protein n=1 Tax=Natrinema soli TaxID=1930624 RepID=A0ABD5SRV4_9EURY|nr:hypothetical protein [Natrinema soli]